MNKLKKSKNEVAPLISECTETGPRPRRGATS
jgi:hypothetical protein